MGCATRNQGTQQKSFSFDLSTFEEAVLKRFHTLTKVDMLDKFSSDDFRLYGLDRHFENPQQEIGSFFAKLVHHRKVRVVGRERSLLPKNNKREIKVYEWCEKSP